MSIPLTGRLFHWLIEPQLLIATFSALLIGYFYRRWRETKLTRPESSKAYDDGQEETDDNIAPGFSEENYSFIPLDYKRLPELEMQKRAEDYYTLMNQRRSVRHFSSDPIPIKLIQNLIKTAGTSPSGANTQPWTFAAVMDPGIKSQLRQIVEEEEAINYQRRMGDVWVQDLKKFKTNAEKQYIDDAPCVIVLLKQVYGLTESGERINHYYHDISVSIAAGLFIAAVQNAGLVTLTSTPLNAGGAIRNLLGRPSNEKVVLLLPIGYPAPGAKVPNIGRKPLADISAFY